MPRRHPEADQPPPRLRRSAGASEGGESAEAEQRDSTVVRARGPRLPRSSRSILVTSSGLEPRHQPTCRATGSARCSCRTWKSLSRSTLRRTAPIGRHVRQPGSKAAWAAARRHRRGGQGNRLPGQGQRARRAAVQGHAVGRWPDAVWRLFAGRLHDPVRAQPQRRGEVRRRRKSAAISKELEGTWKGAIDAGGVQRQVSLTLANRPDGTSTRALRERGRRPRNPDQHDHSERVRVVPRCQAPSAEATRAPSTPRTRS